jgi:Protein of unknown function (DUF1778)
MAGTGAAASDLAHRILEADYHAFSIPVILGLSEVHPMPTTKAEHETLTLSPRDWEAFLAALDDADRPRPRLEAAARRYQSRREGDGC